MTSAAIYVRVSTSRQAEHDLSLPDQVAQCRKFCEARGWEVAEIFSEPGASALDEDRPVFQEMIYKAKRSDHPFDFVVVHSLSRFSRDSLHSEFYVRQLAKCGVTLVSITQDVGQDASGDFIRKMFNIFDEHQSRENAKHVQRAMNENARQGFWNGARPPYGYATRVAERRGSKDKKVLVIDEDEARVVRMIFSLAIGESGAPMGVKKIAMALRQQGLSRRGVPFNTGSVHQILTMPMYYGEHFFNRMDSRTRQRRPPSEWISLQAPPLIPEETFNLVQGLLQSRSPRRVPPRVVNGPTLLAGVARCGYCDAALIQNTGKGGRYRYYCCSRKLKEGPMACTGLRMPMDQLDDIVVAEISKRVLDPDHLREMLEAYVKASSDRESQVKERLSRLRHAHTDAKAGISRLLGLAEKGLMDAEDPDMRERLVGLKLKRDELAHEIAELQKRAAEAQPTITPEKIAKVALLLKDRLNNGEPDFRQAYARLLMDEVRVTKEQIRISGSKSVLARVASEGTEIPAPAVLSFVQKWRARHDSNV